MYARFARAVIAVSLLAACTSACSKAEDAKWSAEVPESLTSTRTSSAESTGTSRSVHGSYADVLGDGSGPSIPLEEAIEKAGGEVSLPDPDVAGRIKRVVVGETVEDALGRGRLGLGILYRSGVKLWTEPSPIDLQERMRSFQAGDALPFEDGRETPYEVRVIASRETLVMEAGVQLGDLHDERLVVPASLHFNIGDTSYWLRGPEKEDSEIGVEELIAIAESMAPVDSGD